MAKVFVTDYDYQADIKVFRTDYDYQADLLYHEEEYDYNAKARRSRLSSKVESQP